MSKARALYDYQGNEGEISFFEGDLITVTSADAGDGWMMGTLQGQSGYFPQTYVELIDAPAVEDEWEDEAPSYNSSVGNATSSSVTIFQRPAAAAAAANKSNRNSTYVGSGGSGDDSLSKMKRSTTIGRSFNRFSPFVKSGGEAFLLSTSLEEFVPSDYTITVVKGPQWQPSPVAFTVAVTEPTKKSKFKGIKSFVAYACTPSNTDVTVYRRFKHFDWLYERLNEKFTALSVPPIPEKHVGATTNTEEPFVEKRRAQLERWLNRIARHPILSQYEGVQHFLTCNGDEKEWKAGKRKTEKDPFIGAKFFSTVQSPAENVPVDSEQQVERFGKFIRVFDRKLDKFKESAEHFIVFSNVIKSEYQKVSFSISELIKDEWKEEANKDAIWCWRAHCTDCGSLTNAMDVTSKAYHDIGQAFSAQPDVDLNVLLEDVREYGGILPTYPAIVDLHSVAYDKLKDGEKLLEAQKTTSEEVEVVRARCQTISNVVLSELDRFHHERKVDFKAAMENYLKQQIDFYQGIVGRLQNSLEAFQQIP